MKTDLRLQKFQFFIAKFADIYEEDLNEIDKREIILPWDLELQLEKFVLYKKSEEYPHPIRVSITMVQALIEQVQLKIADNDVETLMSVLNYAQLLLGNTEPAKN